jgi:RimJ/RimL family protein N-acetyltransferase
VPENRPAFQRWYADEEIARLLRHDQCPLSERQSRGYFDTIILPLSARGLCYAIHEAATDRLIGTTALTDVTAGARRSALFRIVIGERDCWGRGYGTEATALVLREAFERHGLAQVRLEVFHHNTRALATYRRVGFRITGEHIEWVGHAGYELHVVEMALEREDYLASEADARPPSSRGTEGQGDRRAGFLSPGAVEPGGSDEARVCDADQGTQKVPPRRPEHPSH